jgi:hypothetical protein
MASERKFHQKIPAHCCSVHDTVTVLQSFIVLRSLVPQEKEGLNGPWSPHNRNRNHKKGNMRSGGKYKDSNAIRTRHVQWLPRVKSKSNGTKGGPSTAIIN